MSKHTPGPWTRVNLTICTMSNEEHPNYKIARVFESGIETLAAKTVNQATANANIIMASPDLLEASKEAAKFFFRRKDEPVMEAIDILKILEKAIAKAEGK